MITIILLCLLVQYSQAIRCDRRPFHTTYSSTTSNGRFALDVKLGTQGSKYLPMQQYVVTLSALDENHPFTAFMVWPEGNTEIDYRNPRAKIIKDPGIMSVREKTSIKISSRCPNTIELSNAAPTTYVEMYWQSPEREQGCVTIHAMVAENEEIWYQEGDGLAVEVCEDDSFLGDKSETYNDHCTVCEEAKYELTFEGQWSRNTHPQKFPVDDWSVFYGDMIGASHSREYSMWKDGSKVSEAMYDLAMRNNTAPIEEEILKSYVDGHIRTLIKGKGHGPLNGDMNDPTYALVRVDRNHHLISTATALRPSPDWFLGVSEFELCQMNNTWLPYKTLNLIPWDAGINNGISFESPYEPASDTIARVRVGSFDKESPFYNMNYKQVKPFATLTIRLIRTYPKPQCEQEEGEEEAVEEKGTGEETQPEPPSRRTSPSPEENVPSSDEEGEQSPSQTQGDCPLSNWDEWTPCSNVCGPGYRSRSRYHMVNGYEYRYYRPDERRPNKIEKPSNKCLQLHEDDTLETEECEGDCIVPEARVAPADTEELVSRHSRTVVGGAQHCVMSSWSRWSACTGSCDQGSQMRTRSVIFRERNGGRKCPKRHLVVRKCNLDPCPVLEYS